MEDILKNSWYELLKDEFKKDYYKDLMNFLDEEVKEYNIYPEKKDVFNALNFTDYNDVKAVIFGQDPYHGKDQAYGLAFSVQKGQKIPPSLRNIYKELSMDMGCSIPDHGDLTSWAKQGVLLLNTVLTVREKTPNSHKDKGWEIFTNKIISQLNEREDGIVFILWGKEAYKKEELITNPQHHIIKSFHPSPFSAYRGFFGSKPFSKTNEILRYMGEKEINWCID